MSVGLSTDPISTAAAAAVTPVSSMPVSSPAPQTGSPIPTGPLPASQNRYSEAVLWYNVGLFGQLGYGLPNPGSEIGTLNPNIGDIVRLVGRSLFLIMHSEDADIDKPPSINTLTKIHQLYIRAGNVLSGRAVPPAELRPEVQHAQPAGEIFTVYPCPFFKVRNAYMRRWANWIMICLSEMMQNQENRQTVAVSTDFAAMVGQWLSMAYQNMAIEMFGVPRATALAPGFLLTAAQLAAYNPGAFFTSQEMIDDAPSYAGALTNQRLSQLSSGILISQLPPLTPYPNDMLAIVQQIYLAQNQETNPDTGQTIAQGVTNLSAPAPVFPQGGTFAS